MAREIGSIWRRWDLHIHTPDTIHNDEYEGWDPFIAALAAQDAVPVLGITDYLSIENYRRMRREKARGALPSIALILPNIEFRISPHTRRGRGINLHLLVSPEDAAHEDKIDEALMRLNITSASGQRFSCVPAQLMQLGRTINPQLRAEDRTADRAALREGANQFKVEFGDFKRWYESEGWLRRNSITVIDGGEADGAAGLQHDDGFRTVREGIYAFSGAVFSGRPADRDFWLGRSHGLEPLKPCGGMKPCLHGSDAHSLAKLLQPDERRYCWIKADMSFEGLRQTLYEPEERVWIGENPPDLHDRSRTIRSVSFSDASEWFAHDTLPLNPGLAAVIGQKGMGKSALNDLIAFAAGSWKAGDTASFVDRARSHLTGMRVRLEWGDGRLTECAMPTKGAFSASNEVRYLSQQFVERLCADHQRTGELVREIESVIFGHLDATDTLNASSFQDLRDKRTSAIRAEQDRLVSQIRRLNREIQEVYKRKLTLPDRRARCDALGQDRQKLVEQLPPPEGAQEQEIATQLEAERIAIETLTVHVAAQKEIVVRIDGIREKVRAFRTQMERFWSDITADLREVGIAPEKQQAFRPLYQGDVEQPLNERYDTVLRVIDAAQGDETTPAEDTIRSHQRRYAALSEQSTADQAKKGRLAELQSRISAIDTDLRRVRQEIEVIEGPEAEKLTSLRAERRAAYADYFDTLRREQKILAELYRPLQDSLGGNAEAQARELAFDIRWVADLDGWAERGIQLFDQRKALPYPNAQAIRDAAAEHLLAAWSGGTREQLEAGLDHFLLPFGDPGIAVPASLKSNVGPADFFDWLHSVDHIRLSYSLSYNGTALENLSPGTKGIVLLILYLAMDKQDTRPLLVDQPEENLDNESIYNLLASYFRRAKMRRQILLITHNPNLVVNTDAEQVIVATSTRRGGGLPTISYSAGALENAVPPDGIRQQVCRILEGGEQAFHKREQRYAFGT